jgi:hypothetical protein
MGIWDKTASGIASIPEAINESALFVAASISRIITII